MIDDVISNSNVECENDNSFNFDNNLQDDTPIPQQNHHGNDEDTIANKHAPTLRGNKCIFFSHA